MIYTDLPLSDLACPLPNRDGSFIEELAAEHARQTLSLFTERYAGHVGGSELLSLLADSAEGHLPFDTVWHPAFGGIHAGLSEQGPALDQRAAACALRLHECGYGGEWELRLSTPVSFHLNRWRLPAGDALRVSATGDSVTVSVRADEEWKTVTTRHRGDEWLLTGGAVTLPCLRRPDTEWIVWGRDQLQSWELLDIAINLEESGPELMVPRCDAALGVLHDFAPDHFSWVSKVVRFVAPWRVEDGQRPSSNLAPGLVGVGNHDHAPSLADSLVHEASHHYYYTALRLGKVDDGSDPTLYYNPFLERKRPINRILLAYHAFGNVLLFCRAAKANGLGGDEYISERERQLEEQLSVLGQALRSTGALTPLGRALWEPIYEQCNV
jgi:HEXXH motif-containing protein